MTGLRRQAGPLGVVAAPGSQCRGEGLLLGTQGLRGPGQLGQGSGEPKQPLLMILLPERL